MFFFLFVRDGSDIGGNPKVTWSCKGSNATGPDGFDFNLYKKAWPIIGDEMF